MIVLEDVAKSFASRGRSAQTGSVQALDGVSLTIDRGEIFGVIGRSGAGKLTLIRLINLLERPTRGSVPVDGKDLTALGEAELRAESGGHVEYSNPCTPHAAPHASDK